MDLHSVFFGYLFCMFCDVIFSVAQHFLEKARYYSELRKFVKNKQNWGSDK